MELQRDQFETTMENLWYTSYRDHQMGQPVRGVRENVANLTVEDVQQWVSNHCVGNNLVVSVTGDCQHEEVVDHVNSKFGSMAQSNVDLANTDKPIHTPSLMFMRDDEMANYNTAVFLVAPTWTNEDYWAFILLNHMIGEYREDRHTGANLNAVDRQYSSMHKLLGNLPDISIQKSMYIPGSDYGLFGSYLHGNEVHATQMCFVSQLVASEYAYHMQAAEVFRSRNAFWNELLNESGNNHQNNAHVANEVIHLGRRVPRSEQALRVSNCADIGHMQRVCTEWIWDKELSAAGWGPMHSMAPMASYNRAWRRSTLGYYGTGVFNVQ